MELSKWVVTPRQCCDLEMLLVGGFSPLSGFLSKNDYESVLATMRLADGKIWPMPITLDVNDAFAEKIKLGDEIELCDPDNTLLARMKITDKWQPEKAVEAQKVFGTQDIKHPAVNNLLNNQNGTWYLGGPVSLVQLPRHYDFVELRHTPATLKQFFKEAGWKNIVAFQTRNPIHRAHMELTLRAMKQYECNLLIHPVVGMTKPGDVDYFTRVRCYKEILKYYPEHTTALSLLPLAMRMGGPREALWHALIRKNYGCTHFIVGRDHAGPGNDSFDQPFYDPYAAQKLVEKFQDEIGIQIITFQEMVYVKERQQYVPFNELTANDSALTISGTQLRHALLHDDLIPPWFSFPEIITELRKTCLPKHKQGVTIFFTGLSGSGKTTVARALMAYLQSHTRKAVTLLDGDVVRRILASELGFSKEDRDLNVRRLGFVASEVTKAGGLVLCAAIAPYAEVRLENRRLISQVGGYVEIYVATPLKTCEQRDTKKLYAKARRGELKGFTGINDPYEMPSHPEVTLDTSVLSIEESVEKIIHYLVESGYLTLESRKKTRTVIHERVALT